MAKVDKKVSLREAVKFHGHLGPYLVLGLRAGEFALKQINCRKYFGLKIKVYGASEKPRSCFIDGLQLSTGATYGKGNIQKFNGPMIRAEFYNERGKKRLSFRFNEGLISRLAVTNTHRDCEALARELYRADDSRLFKIIK